MDNLSFEQLSALLTSVFAPAADERWLTILVDLPDDRVPDNVAWQDRRRLAREWAGLLHANAAGLPFTAVAFCTYRNVRSHNNELPATASVTVLGDGGQPGATGGDPPADDPTPAAGDTAALPEPVPMAMDDVLASSSVVIAPTEFSATAPLKLLARKHRFRGATLPGFSRAMLPALQLPYDQVSARVHEFRERMDRADAVSITLAANGQHYTSLYDLRFRTGHASGGLMREPATVGNLPSGEAYIVPYEGERDGQPSRTAGELPVQFGDDVVVFRVERNRAVEVLSTGPEAERQRRLLSEEPAYGNIAEVGIGVLGEWGVQAIGSMLLDEKLGLHIAFGRSDHFGGATGPADFRDPERVAHIDWVYVGSTQPLISVRDVTFMYDDGGRETIIENDSYVV